MEVEVKIINKHTLELTRDAKCGDIIDLNNIRTIDNEIITTKIDEAFKIRLQEEIQNTRNKTLLEVNEKINSYNNQISLLKKERDDIKVITLTEEKSKQEINKINLENDYNLKINNLNNKINELTNELKQIEDNTTQKLNNELNKEINKLKEENLIKLQLIEKQKNELLLNEQVLNNQIQLLNQEKKQFDDIAKAKLEQELTKTVSELTVKHQKELLNKDEEINKLVNQRAVKNIKQTGEDLEAWCDSEIKNYMQNGLFNCVWSKDNTVVRNEEESKGSKADFLFNIFADHEHTTLLTNICLEMKDENPDSIHRRKNDSYFSALDKNRTKKNCKYALLVSNLELDKPNDIPMYRVLEYPDMYVVRPAYLMTFLNIIVSLSVKFKEAIINIEKEKIEFKSSIDILDEFEDLKRKYLDKPLELLEKEILAITTASKAIITSAEKINNCCDNIKNKYIEDIENKLSRFNITKLNKKIAKVE